jgi:hypothetical protein
MNKKVALVVLILLLAGMGVVVFNQVLRHTGQAPKAPVPQVAEAPAPSEPQGAEQGAAVTGQLSMKSPEEAPVVAPEPGPSEQQPAAEPPAPEPGASGGAVTGMAPAPKFELQPPGATPPAVPAPEAAAPVVPAPGVATPAPAVPATPASEVVKAPAAPAQVAEKAAKPAAKPAAKKAATATSGPNALKTLAVSVEDGAVTVAVAADKPVGGVKHFFLKSPWRLVVDLYGDFAPARDPAVPDNAAVKSVRLGRHKDKLRMVLDLTGDYSSKAEVVNEQTGARIVIRP